MDHKTYPTGNEYLKGFRIQKSIKTYESVFKQIFSFKQAKGQHFAETNILNMKLRY